MSSNKSSTSKRIVFIIRIFVCLQSSWTEIEFKRVWFPIKKWRKKSKKFKYLGTYIVIAIQNTNWVDILKIEKFWFLFIWKKSLNWPSDRKKERAQPYYYWLVQRLDSEFQNLLTLWCHASWNISQTI